MSDLADDFRHLPPLLTPAEAATMLRVKVSAIYKRKYRGTMPGVIRQGKNGFLIRKAALIESLRQQSVPSVCG